MGLGNSPKAQTPIRLIARTSYALNVDFVDAYGKPCDITGAVITFVAVKPKYKGGANVMTIAATLTEPIDGRCRVDLQATVTDLPAGQYPYALRFQSADNYSSIVLQGELEVLDNPSTSTVGVFSGVEGSETIPAKIVDSQVVTVVVNHLTAPGLSVAAVETLEPGDPAGAYFEGRYPHQILHLRVPKGDKGDKPTIAIGSVTVSDGVTPPGVTYVADIHGDYTANFVLPQAAPWIDTLKVKTASYDMLATDDVIVFNAPSGLNFVVRLPNAATIATGHRVMVKNKFSGTIQINATQGTSKNIDGASTYWLDQYESAIFIYDGTEWGVY